MRLDLFGIATLALISGCATPLPPNLPLSDAIREKAASLVANGQAESATGNAEAIIHLRAAGNLGMIWTYSLSQRFAKHADGLSEDLATSMRTSGANSPSTSIRTLSVCGLITLKSESATAGAAGALVFVPSAGSVTPIPIGNALPAGNREVATSLDIPVTGVCAPTVGSTFTYRIGGQWERSVYGPLGTIRLVNDFVETTSCTAQALTPEYQYLAALGATLTVRCNHKSIGGRPTDSVFAYLPGARRYILVYLGYGESTYNRIEYKSVHYK